MAFEADNYISDFLRAWKTHVDGYLPDEGLEFAYTLNHLEDRESYFREVLGTQLDTSEEDMKRAVDAGYLSDRSLCKLMVEKIKSNRKDEYWREFVGTYLGNLDTNNSKVLTNLDEGSRTHFLHCGEWLLLDADHERFINAVFAEYFSDRLDGGYIYMNQKGAKITGGEVAIRNARDFESVKATLENLTHKKIIPWVEGN